jgi:hypothetical protein
VYSTLVFDAGSRDRFTGQFTWLTQIVDSEDVGSPQTVDSAGTVTATRITCPPPGAVSQEAQVDVCWGE